MDRQLDILTFVFEEYEEEDLPVSTGSLFEDYKEEKDYTGSKPSFSELLSKLNEKGLLESPEYGHYQLSDKGEKKADYTLNPEKFDSEKSEGYQDLVEELVYFLDVKKEEEVRKATVEGKNFTFSLSEFSTWNPDDFDKWFEEKPEKFFEALDEAVVEAGDTDEPIEYEVDFSGEDLDHLKTDIYQARSGEKFNRPVILEGTIEYSEKPMHERYKGVFECQECGDTYEKEQDTGQSKSPYKCDCGSKKFDVVEVKRKNKIDLRISQTTEENSGIEAILYPNELGDNVQRAFRPGNKIRVLGILKAEIVNKNSTEEKPFVKIKDFKSQEKRLDTSEIPEEKKAEVREKVRDFKKSGDHPFYVFSRSLAPEIKGMDTVKEVIGASLIGGTGIKDDGRIHTYIIGNPGTGKSKIQDYIGETFPNSHYADMSNATAVGLTATVESKDGDGYRLIAGKLVYADKGILSIDEFDNIKEDQAKRLNRAMDKGEFDLDKATQHAKLPGEATIIATANYQDTIKEDDFIDEFKPKVHESTEDRFSLVYCMPPEKGNEEATDSILDQFQGQDVTAYVELSEEEQVVYRELARQKEPVLSSEASELIKKWVKGQEQIAESKFKRPEFKGDSKRFLVSLGKLTTMFARAGLKDTADSSDAKKAIRLYVTCRESRGVSEGSTVKQKRKKNRQQAIKEKIEEISEPGDYPSTEAVLAQLEKETRFDYGNLEETVDLMKSEGELYEPQSGKIDGFSQS